jgi:hypothetical protein
MTKATRVGIKLDQLLSMSGGQQEASCFGQGTITHAIDNSGLHLHRARAALDYGVSDSVHNPTGGRHRE